MEIELWKVKIGQVFIFENEEYELLNHDDSGSLSAGPTCKRLKDNEIVYLNYLDWSGAGGHNIDKANRVLLKSQLLLDKSRSLFLKR